MSSCTVLISAHVCQKNWVRQAGVSLREGVAHSGMFNNEIKLL